MAKDPYETLGVERNASDKEIKAAFRKLTRAHHPDLHPGDAGAADRFKEISAAHDLLSDPEQRRRFDAGEIDATGAERPQQRYYRDFAGAGTSAHARQDGFASDAELEEFLARAFGSGAGVFGARRQARGADAHFSLTISFLDAVNGARREVTLPDGHSLRLTVPEGAEDGQLLRLKGQGLPGYEGGPAGDAYVELRVEPHPFFQRRDDNIHVEVPVTLKEAVLGGRIEVPTIGGPVALTVPPQSGSGRVLRLRDKGVRNRRTGQRGHQYVTLRLVLPEGEEPELVRFLEGWQPRNTLDPRREMLQ